MPRATTKAASLADGPTLASTRDYWSLHLRSESKIGIAVEADARVGVRVGLAELDPGDTAVALTERADVAMLQVKAAHHSVRQQDRRTPCLIRGWRTLERTDNLRPVVSQ